MIRIYTKGTDAAITAIIDDETGEQVTEYEERHSGLLETCRKCDELFDVGEPHDCEEEE